MDAREWRAQSVFAVKQDTRLLGQFIVAKGVGFLEDIIAKRGIDLSSYQHFLPHLSSNFFRQEIHKGLAIKGLAIPDEIWFTNLERVGNVGSASPFLMLEEIFHSDKLKKGDKILMMIPESARFIYAYIQLTVV
ncbi:3-oxoacyl-(acyl carrier protein) synthase III [compost metagenome]